MHLGVDPFASLVDQLDGVTSVTVHEPIAFWNASVAHEDHDLMDRLRILGEVVPEHGRVVSMGEMGCRVALLGVDELRELGRVAQKEHRSIVGNIVPVALFSPELDGKASGIPSQVVGSRFATNGREADGDGALLALVSHEVRLADIIDWIGTCEGSMSPTALGMDDTLRDALAVEV